jgi:hypothetical protein
VPMAVPVRDDFADLLPPVGYQQPAGSAARVPGGAPAGAVARQGGPAAGAPGQRAGTAPGAARFLLVLATMLGLIAVSVLLPLAGAAAALVGLMLLRAADLTTARQVKRRAGQAGRPASAVSAVVFYPWAIVRTVLRFVLLAPVALVCAAGAAAVTVLVTGTADLPRAASYAAGALVACYGLGPGSAGCRRPLGNFYGRAIRSAPAALLGGVAVAAVAIAVVIAALRLAPGYWPAAHLGSQLQAAATTSHPALSNVADVGRRLVHWFEHI